MTQDYRVKVVRPRHFTIEVKQLPNSAAWAEFPSASVGIRAPCFWKGSELRMDDETSVLLFA